MIHLKRFFAGLVITLSVITATLILLIPAVYAVEKNHNGYLLIYPFLFGIPFIYTLGSNYLDEKDFNL